MLPGSSWATELDLTTALSAGLINGSKFETTNLQPTGTGVIEPFLRVQMKGTERGYNTAGTLQFDTKSGIWTHPIQVGQLAGVNIGGIQYAQFLLDINESNSADGVYLSLNYMKFYLAGVNNLTGYGEPSPLNGDGSGTGFGTSATLIWDLDAGGNNTVLMNYDLNPGSGGGDLYAYVPMALFGNDPFKFIYLYSGFGYKEDVIDEWSSSAGFEEWAVLQGTHTNPVPEPGTMMLLGSGLVGLAGWGRKKFRK